MNLPNKLSLFRIVIIPVFLLCLLSEQILGVESPLLHGLLMVLALILTIIVAVTDWADGKIAREQNLSTSLGKLLDPLADKIFVTAALIGFVEIGIIPAWSVIIIIAREFLITGLRSIAADKGRVIGADTLGKHKTGWQLGVIIAGIFLMAVQDLNIAAGAPVAPWLLLNISTLIIWGMLTVVLLLTVDSGVGYLWKNRDLFRGEI